MLSACINVCANSVTESSDSSTIEPVPKGARGRTIEMQFERVRLEKQLLEKNSTTLEEKNRLVVATNDQLNRNNRELRDEVRNLRLEMDRVRGQNEDRVDAVNRSRQLESQNSLLHNSLVDIAQVVLEDADKDEASGHNISSAKSKSVSVLRTSSPLRSHHRRSLSGEFSGLTPLSASRRARSASPAMVESTLAAVQAALNRRQLQVHELRSKLASAEETADRLTAELQAKDGELEVAGKKLDSFLTETDAVRLQLDESKREATALREKLDSCQSEQMASAQSAKNLQQEVRSLVEEKKSMSELLVRNDREVQNCKSRVEASEKAFKKMEREMREKNTLIGKLESVGSALREELLQTQDELEQARRDLEMVRREKTDTVDSANVLEARTATKEAEVYRLRTEEKRLREALARADASKDRAAKMCLEYEDSLAEAGEEKVALKVELAEKEGSIDGLRQEVASLEEVVARERSSKAKLEGLLKENEDVRERVSRKVNAFLA